METYIKRTMRRLFPNSFRIECRDIYGGHKYVAVEMDNCPWLPLMWTMTMLSSEPRFCPSVGKRFPKNTYWRFESVGINIDLMFEKRHNNQEERFKICRDRLDNEFQSTLNREITGDTLICICQSPLPIDLIRMLKPYLV